MDDLFSQICSFKNMHLAAKKAMKGKKSKVSACRFYFDLEPNIFKLQEELQAQTYTPRPLHHFRIYEPKERLISCSDIRDRVVHHSIFNIIAGLFERRFIYHSYACRPKKGSHKAIKQAQAFTRKYRYYLKCDISKFFYSIDHQVLESVLYKIVAHSPKTLDLLKLLIDFGSTSGVGLPIGNLSSQYFANLYLGELDLFIKNDLRIKGYLRYMDDFILFFNSKSQAHEALKAIRDYVGKKLKLELNERALTLSPCANGLSFFGFRIYPQLIRIKRENLIRLRKKMKYCLKYPDDESLVASVQSMMKHIKQADSYSLRVKEFVNI